LVWQSMLEVQEAGRGVWKYFALYSDVLKSFNSASDMAQGIPPEGEVPLGQVRDVKVGSMGFVLQFQSFNLAFRVSTELGALDAWVTALHRVLVFNSTPPQAAPSLKLAHQGPLEVVEGGQARLQHFCLFPDRLESYGNTTDAIAGKRCQDQVLIADVVGFKVLDHGFIIRLPEREMELRVVGREDLEVWLGAFRGVLANQSRNRQLGGAQDSSSVPKTPVFGSGPQDSSASTATPRAKAGAKNRAAASTGRTIHEGLLGIQHGGQLSNKYFMLFTDRLDYHDTKEDAYGGARPKGRIALSEVSSYEAYGSGFILKLLGRSVGLHVGQDQKAAEGWLGALKQALQHCVGSSPNGGSSGSLAQSRGASGVSRAAPGHAGKAKMAGTPPRSSSSTALGSREAVTPPRTLGRTGSAGSLTNREQQASVSRLFTPRARHEALSPSARSDVSKRSDGGNSVASSQPPDWARTYKTEGRVRGYDGAHWKNSGFVAPKIANRDPDERFLTRSRVEERTTQGAAKVTGDQTFSGTIPARRNRNCETKLDKEFERLTPRSNRGLADSQKAHAWDITGKVHEEGRTFVKPANRPDHVDFASKVTGSDRDSRIILSRGRASLPDKVQTMQPNLTAPNMLSMSAGLSVAERVRHDQKSPF